jgi:ABC-2 type transport system permease protein/fluoroquinolone transport system permease protein
MVGAILSTPREASPFLLLSSRSELETFVTEGRGSAVLVEDAEGDADPGMPGLSFTIIHRSPAPRSTDSLIRAQLEDVYARATGISRAELPPVTILRPGAPVVDLADRLLLVMLALEAMILGFLFVAVSIFQEKQEGSIRAYRVSPGGLVTYVASKVLVFSLIGTIYGLLMVLFTRGPMINWISLAPLLFFSCLFMTTLGLAVAAHFRNISEWFAPGVILLAVNMFSILPYQLPGYANPLLTALPGYQMIYAMTEILYPSGKSGYLNYAFLWLAIYLIIAAGLAFPSVKFRMLREGT